MPLAATPCSSFLMFPTSSFSSSLANLKRLTLMAVRVQCWVLQGRSKTRMLFPLPQLSTHLIHLMSGGWDLPHSMQSILQQAPVGVL